MAWHFELSMPTFEQSLSHKSIHLLILVFKYQVRLLFCTPIDDLDKNLTKTKPKLIVHLFSRGVSKPIYTIDEKSKDFTNDFNKIKDKLCR